MKKAKEFLIPHDSCNHCGGIMREYLGLETCMMCGRIAEHHCPDCANAAKEEPMVRTA